MSGLDKTSIGIIAGGVSGLALGSTLGFLAGKTANRKGKKKRTSTKRKNRKVSRYNRKRRGRRYPHTAGRRRDTSHRRIRYTKNGQPYIILRSGKARFIKQKSVKNSRKRKGGKY